MTLMVWLKDIYQGGDIEGDVPFTHTTLHYNFSLLLHWVLKYLLRGHQVQSILQIWLLFLIRLDLVLSSNMLKGWTFSWEIYSPYPHIHIIGSRFWCLVY